MDELFTALLRSAVFCKKRAEKRRKEKLGKKKGVEKREVESDHGQKTRMERPEKNSHHYFLVFLVFF